MTQLTLITPWDGHWRLGEYLSFVQWAVGQETILKNYRASTGDVFQLSANSEAMARQVQSGEVAAFLQRFSDWVAPNVFGLPDDVETTIAKGRTLH